MKIKRCKDCNEEISKKAKVCPKCGCKQGLPTIVKILIIIGIICLCIGGCVSSCTKSVDDAVKEVKDSYKDKNGKTKFKLNETFENSHEKITMLEVNTNFEDLEEYFKPTEGKKVLMAKFEIENVSKENDEIYVSSAEFNASADGIVLENFYGAKDKYNDFSATVGKGKKTIGYVFYEVPKDAKNITIEYNADFWTDGNTIKFIIQ